MNDFSKEIAANRKVRMDLPALDAIALMSLKEHYSSVTTMIAAYDETQYLTEPEKIQVEALMQKSQVLYNAIKYYGGMP